MDSLIKRRCRKVPQCIREMLAELMGTLILIMFGVGSVAQFVLGKSKFGGFISVNFGWALGVTFGIHWSLGVSGGHINPAVTLAMAVSGRLPWRKVPFYWAGQTLGALIASAICYGLYHDLIEAYEGSERSLKTAGIWSTYPTAGVSHWTAFFDQVVGTALLVGTVFALIDKKNESPNSQLFPFIVGLLVLAIGISFGINCGYGINPARDFMPRLFTAIAGWKELPLKANDYWFWIPIVGQFVGSILGYLTYMFAVELHHPGERDVMVTYTTQEKERKSSSL
ncbi:aquaporin-7-like [Hydractinia symbiolongicarpus]|uniref:aquaporin-7-like n=1 Tax=Hydractinia symbiolongicarpus TaxID=13093 RepID=UPI00254ACC99|nr:aquaporin-7-like [Hydractinia symbiolongicarpus]XP_057296603.1 aquaporin-7-like [Hydractinia symbiolongicarpus]